jgi:hypothetical protein
MVVVVAAAVVLVMLAVVIIMVMQSEFMDERTTGSSIKTLNFPSNISNITRMLLQPSRAQSSVAPEAAAAAVAAVKFLFQTAQNSTVCFASTSIPFIS